MMQFNLAIKSLLFVFLLSIFPTASFSVSSGMEEVRHLLHFVGNSGCTFIRNGEEYSAKKAREHMEYKYSYARIWIDDGDDFIKSIATKSSATGEKYKIRCNGVTQSSTVWLNLELARYREQH